MKKIILSVLLFISVSSFHAQGLENIRVEKWNVIEGSQLITYRVFVDMKPGYNLQSVYGAPGHELILRSSSYLYNHPETGNYIPNLIRDQDLVSTALLQDSWISAGAGSQFAYAVGLEEARVKSGPSEALYSGSNLNRPGFMYLDELPPRVTQVGLDSLLILLDKESNTGKKFSFTTTNGGWGCVGGAKGPVPETNVVCIGQFTTSGDLYFEFNIQIGSPEHGVEQYVSRNPEGKEQLFPGLIVSVNK